jgi:hypothetical protein
VPRGEWRLRARHVTINGMPESPEASDEILTVDQAIQLRVAHLTLIQGIISRIASYSAAVKGVSVTIVTAILALYSQKTDLRLGLMAVIVIAIFALLDARYLCSERAFRSLYDSVRRQPLRKASDFYIGASFVVAHKTREAVFSWSVLWFYLPLAGAVVALLIVFG